MVKLDFYTCTVRLGGNLSHEVNKENISNLELKVLRAIHGGDAVVNVKRVESRDVDEMEEYYRLARTYTKERIEAVLRISLDDFDAWMEQEREKEEQAREEASRRRQAEFTKGQRERQLAAIHEAAKGDTPATVSQQPPVETVT